MTFVDGYLIGGGIVLVVVLLAMILYILIRDRSTPDLNNDELQAAVEKAEAITARLKSINDEIRGASTAVAGIEPTPPPTEGN